MKKYFLGFDLAVQCFAVGFYFFKSIGFNWNLILLAGFLGLWQFFGNMIYIIFEDTKNRILYSKVSVATIFYLFFVVFVLSRLYEILEIAYSHGYIILLQFWLPVPFVAVWYVLITFQELKSETT